MASCIEVVTQAPKKSISIWLDIAQNRLNFEIQQSLVIVCVFCITIGKCYM